MRLNLVILALSAFTTARGFAQGQQAKTFNPRDLAGIWTRNSNGMGGGGTCRECGDRGFGNNVPPFTEEGQKRFDQNKPSYGRALGSADANANRQGTRAESLAREHAQLTRRNLEIMLADTDVLSSLPGEIGRAHV